MDAMAVRGWFLKNENGTYSLPNNAEGIKNYQLFKSLLQTYIDSYLIVGMTVNGLMETSVIIEQTKLVNELHVGVQEIYYQNGIKFMNSCLIEVLNSAFARFAEIGFCK